MAIKMRRLKMTSIPAIFYLQSREKKFRFESFVVVTNSLQKISRPKLHPENVIKTRCVFFVRALMRAHPFAVFAFLPDAAFETTQLIVPLVTANTKRIV